MTKRSSLILIGLVFATFTFGVLGYSTIEGWSLADSFYMTMITVTTTGYEEVHPLSPAGRLFTIILLACGVGTVAYSVSYFMQDLFSIDFETKRRIKMTKTIGNLENHIILCGYGRMGRVVCKELAQLKETFVVIENNSASIEELKSTGFMWLEGDATNDSLLMDAGITRAKTLVSMVDSDADSLYISLAGRSLNEKLYIIARGSDQAAKLKILRAGADRVILPVLVSALKAAQIIVTPEVDDLLDIGGLNLSQTSRVQVAEVPISVNSQLYKKSLRTSGIKLDKAIVIGIRHPDDTFTFAPDANYKFDNGDTLITLSTAETFNEMKEKYLS